MARGRLTDNTLLQLASRELTNTSGREQFVRQAEIRRIALALTTNRRELKTNAAQLQEIVNDTRPRSSTNPVAAR